MGNLILVRHGQARPFEKQSDRLSPLGEEQSRALGRFWIRQGISFDEVYCGTLLRQKETAEMTGQCFAEAGLNWPRIHSTPEFNEYDADGLIKRFAPALAEGNGGFRALLDAFEQNRNSPERNRHFQKMLEAVASVWMKGEMQIDGVESWAAFCSRVRGAIKKILGAEGSGRRIAVFTSGGVIGLTVQTALEAPEQRALEINWRVRNCSLTEFVFSRHRFSLDSFNTIPHLQQPSLQTYR